MAARVSQERVLTPFGTVFRELRVKAGLSQVAVATAAEVSTGYVGLIRDGPAWGQPVSGRGQATGRGAQRQLR